MQQINKNRQKRSRFEKLLISIIFLLLCFSLAILVTFFLNYNTKYIANENVMPCNTKECVDLSATVMNYIQPEIDPCDNFYDFACGKFIAKQHSTTLNQMEAVAEKQINRLISENLEDPIAQPLQLQRKFYQKCLNLAEIDEDNDNTLINLLQNLDVWPILYGGLWDETKFNWLKATSFSRKLGLPYKMFISIGLKYPQKSDDLLLLSITPPKETHVANELKEEYLDLVTNVSIELGAPKTQAKSDMIQLLHFEDQINAFIRDENQEGRNIVYNVSELIAEFPAVPWLPFLRKITNSSSVNLSTSLNFRAKRYLSNLLNLLSKTSKKHQANYMMWKIVEEYKYFLKRSNQQLFSNFLKQEWVENTRKNFCLKTAKLYFPSVAELSYIKNHISLEERTDLNKIISAINKVFLRRIKYSQWVDEATKNYSTEHFGKIEKHIAIAEELWNSNAKDLEIDKSSFEKKNMIEMLMELSKLKEDNFFRMMGQKMFTAVKKDLAASPIITVNAFYLNEYNLLILPAPLLQSVVYSIDKPYFAKFGAIGSIIGHELTHAFFAKEVQEKWENNTKNIYKEKSKCVTQEFMNYSNHQNFFATDPNLSLRENIADLIGSEIAYAAYQEWTTEVQEAKLPGLNYTQNQLFWIMSAIYKCHPSGATDTIDQEHATPNFLVNFSKRNSLNFGVDYNCPEKSGMYTEEKCYFL